VVEALVHAGELKGDEIAGLLDHQDEGAVAGSEQSSQRDASERFQQTSQWRMESLTSVRALESRSATGRSLLRMWKARRSAERRPMPGREANSAMSRSTVLGYAATLEVPNEAAAGGCLAMGDRMESVPDHDTAAVVLR
jgi:hypothetical protein